MFAVQNCTNVLINVKSCVNSWSKKCLVRHHDPSPSSILYHIIHHKKFKQHHQIKILLFYILIENINNFADNLLNVKQNKFEIKTLARIEGYRNKQAKTNTNLEVRCSTNTKRAFRTAWVFWHTMAVPSLRWPARSTTQAI